MSDTASFLGRGWHFPPSFSRGGGEVEMISGAEDIHQSLQILVSTEPGERLMQDDYGCDMNGFAFEEIDQGLRNTMRRIVSDAVLYHEPRIKLEGLTVSESEAEQGVLLISIDYTVRGTNSRYNMVFPFYTDEASAPGP